VSPAARIVILGTLLGASCAPQAHAPVPVAQSADLVARPLVLPPAEPPCTGETAPYEVEAYIRWADGTPAEGIPFGFDADNTGSWSEMGRTGPDGRVTVTLDHVGRIGVIGYLADHPARCARPPRETAKALEELSIARVCPVTVVARGVDGAPIAGTRVGWEARQGSKTFRGEAESETDASGATSLPDLPCGEVAVHAWRAGLAQTRSDRQVPGELRAPCLVGDLENVRTCFVTGRAGAAAGTPTIGVELGPAVELHGRVRDTNGQPVVGARAALLLVGDTVTDADGRFDLWIPPSALREKRFLAVRSPEHSDVTVEVFGDGGTDGLTDAAAQAAPDETGGWATEITLEPTHQVTTHCAGFPGDRCDSLVLTCAIEGKKSLHECAEDDASRCECPASTSATVLSRGRVVVDKGSLSTSGGGQFVKRARVGELLR